jgi:exodeoxyribonuclease VII small subunit
MSRSQPAPQDEPLTFEAALERLQAIVGELEGGELSLEESIARYEEGMKLSRRLTQQLETAEQRIERLLESGNGEIATRAMDLEPREPGGERGVRRGARREPAPERPEPESSEGELPF